MKQKGNKMGSRPKKSINKRALIKIPLFLISLITLAVLISSCCIASKTSPASTALQNSETAPEDKDTAASVEEPVENEAAGTSGIETEKEEMQKIEDLIKVTRPVAWEVVSSPLTVEGEARGTWYFEADFPLKIVDSEGNVIASHYAQAQGEWMTEDFVPFRAEIVFDKPSTETGMLVLEKNNPSGLSENDASLEIPLKFGKDNGKIIEDADPQKGEYFVSAILKSKEPEKNTIRVEQLINEPDEIIISPQVTLSEECIIVKIVLERPQEKQTVSRISLEEIQNGVEIGIIFKPDNTARAIIYQEIIEDTD